MPNLATTSHALARKFLKQTNILLFITSVSGGVRVPEAEAVAAAEDPSSPSPQRKTSDRSEPVRIAKLLNPAARMCCASRNTSRRALWLQRAGREVKRRRPATTTTKMTPRRMTTSRNAAMPPRSMKIASVNSAVALRAELEAPNPAHRITKVPTRRILAITAKNCPRRQPIAVARKMSNSSSNSSRSSSAQKWKSSIALIRLLSQNRMMKTTIMSIGYVLRKKKIFSN